MTITPISDEKSMFPTLVSPTEPSLSDTLDAAQEACIQLIGALQALNRASRGDSADWRRALNHAQGIMDVLESEEPSPALDSSGAFAAHLRRRREEAGLTQRSLAEKVGLSESLIRQLEAGTKRPTPRTVRMLLEVRELGLMVEHMVPVITTGRHREGLHWWVAPNFDAVSMLQELKQRLTAPGGRIEQTFAYLDPQSALDYFTMANEPRYVTSYRNSMPIEQVAEKVVESIGRLPIDLIALGPGDGQQETRFAQALVGMQSEPDLRAYLLDISQPLLSKAHRYAKDRLDAIRGVTVIGMWGNFHYLPLYEQIFYSPARRRRIFTMLGFTLSNLDNEPMFFRDCLKSAEPGDLAILDFMIAFGSTDNPDEIRARDPVLIDPMPQPIKTWLSGPFTRYANATVTDCRYHLDLDCPVPGSYAVEPMLTVKSSALGERQFYFTRARRYDPERLAECLASLGWDRIMYTNFGPITQRNRPALMVLRKRG